MDPANLRMRDDLARLRRLNRPTIRGVAIQPTMGSRSVVIRRVAAKHSWKVAFVEYDNVVEALPTNGADQALAIGVLPGRSRRRQHVLDPHRLDAPSDVAGEDPVLIVEQKARRGAVRKSLDDLSCGPSSAG